MNKNKKGVNMHIRLTTDLLNKVQVFSFWLSNQDIVTLEEIRCHNRYREEISLTHFKNWQLVTKQT